MSETIVGALAPLELSREVRDRFGAFITDKVNPGARERDRLAAPISRALLAEAGQLGLMGFNLPAAIGGGGRRWREWGLVLHEIAALTTDTALPMLLAYCGTVTKLLHETGRADLRERYVIPMVEGRMLGGFGWSEGHDPFAFQTLARPTAGGGYRLDGEKGPIANGLIADVVMVFARQPQSGDVITLLVERQDPGVEIVPFPAMGLRAAGMARWRFSGVEVPSQRVLVGADGLSYGQRFLNERRLEMPCWALGRMRTLFDSCVHDLGQRIRYRQPVTEMQAVQAAIGKMVVALETSRIVVSHILERIDRQEHQTLWDAPLAVAKCHVVGEALKLCRIVQDITGGAGVFVDGPFERTIRDLQCLNPIAGTLATLEIDLGVLASHEVERRQRTNTITKQKGNA